MIKLVKYCKNCGSQLDEGSVFCNECGTKAGESRPKTNQFDDLFGAYNIDMMDDEEIIRHSQIHRGCLILPGVIFGIGIFFGLVNFFIELSYWYYFDAIIAFLGFFNILTIVGLIWFVIRYIGYKTNDLILTNKRVFGKCGLISTTQMQAPLNKIDSVSFQNGLIGKMIGYGTVEVATTSSKFKFRFIRDGQTFYNDIFNQLEISDAEKRVENAKVIVDEIAKKMD